MAPIASEACARSSEEVDFRAELPAKDSVALSIIVTVVGGEAALRRCLTSLVPQVERKPIEIIVPYDESASQIAVLKKDFPIADFAYMGHVKTRCRPGTNSAAHELYDYGRAFGLRTARGRVLALLEDNAIPDPDWCEQLLDAHRLPHGVIGGCVEYEGIGNLDWAVYLQDFGRYQRPLPEGVAGYLTDINVSYKREALFAVLDQWKGRYSELTVHQALRREGATLWRRPQVVVRQNRGPLAFWPTIRERYSWGRLFGRIRARHTSFFHRLAYVVAGPVVPLLLIGRMARIAHGGGRIKDFCLALPEITSLAVAWCLGEFIGNITGRESSD